MNRKSSFAPVVDGNTRVLVLGSLPGEVSLAHGQYYANRQNHFWKLVGQLIGEDLARMAYPTRLQTLLRHRIGLWDVVAEAKRSGSLDSNIREHTGNDVAALAQSLPNLVAIAFNGGTAARIGMRQLGRHAAGYRIIQLPSSSPAYTISFTDKLAAWTALKDVLDTPA